MFLPVAPRCARRVADLVEANLPARIEADRIGIAAGVGVVIDHAAFSGRYDAMNARILSAVSKVGTRPLMNLCQNAASPTASWLNLEPDRECSLQKLSMSACSCFALVMAIA